MCAAARGMVTTLRERAVRSDAARRLLPETERDFASAGLFDPIRSGGEVPELDVSTLLEVGQTLARGCPSSAWVFSLFAVHKWSVRFWGEEARGRVLARPDARVAMVSRPSGMLREVAGGFNLSGEWAFATGIDVATHIALAAKGAPSGADRTKLLSAIVPASSVDVIDDWHVLGLRGTGSKSVRCRDLFVPHSMVRDLRPAESDSADPSLFQPPLFVLAMTAPLLGALELALETYRAGVVDGTEEVVTARVSGDPGLRWSKGEATRRTARSLYRTSATRFARAFSEPPGAHAKLHQTTRLECAEVLRLCLEGVQLLMLGARSREYRESSHLQRAFRDIHMAGAHEALHHVDASRHYASTTLAPGATG